jgi:bacterioferritin
LRKQLHAPATAHPRKAQSKQQAELEHQVMAKNKFLTDIQTLRARARTHIEEGAVTAGYSADRESVLKLLNDSLATELVCVLRYRRHYFMARGIHSQSVAQEFLAHSNEEQGHADQIAERIVQLGGAPDFGPEGLVSRSHAEYVEGNTLASMIKEDLVAERIAIDSYRDIIQYLGEQDPTTRRMMEGILAVEEQHADELADLLVAFPEQSEGDGRTAKSK